jgi:hypothetical protein
VEGVVQSVQNRRPPGQDGRGGSRVERTTGRLSSPMGEAIARGAWSSKDDPLAKQTSEIVGPRIGGVGMESDTPSAGYVAAQVSLMKAVAPMLEHGQRDEPCPHWRMAAWQSRSLLTVRTDGRWHDGLEAVAGEATVRADPFGFRKTPVELPAQLR